MTEPFAPVPLRAERVYLVGTFLAVLIPLFSLPLPFFWDSILLGSEVARHFYVEGLSAWILPAELDSGNPPGFGWYIALWWKALGPTLPVAHLAMIPVLLALWSGYYQLNKALIPAALFQAIFPLAAILLLFEPTFLAQAIHVAPDVLLLALYLLALAALLRGRYLLLALLMSAMCLVSLRGSFAVAALFFTGLVPGVLEPAALHFNKEQKPTHQRLRYIVPFLFAALVSLLWYAYHYSQSGWFLFQPDSPWASNQRFAGISGMLFNAGLIGWRILDFGRLVLWIPGTVWLLGLLRSQTIDPTERRLTAIFLVPLVVLSLLLLPFSNPIAHRYLLPVFVLALPWFSWRIQQLDPTRSRFFIIALVAVLGFGHRWIYPDKVAQGWDASLAHLPYFSLMSKAWSEIPEPAKVFTEFPLYKPMQLIRPGSKQERESFQKAGEDWLSRDYILYSNIINDIPEYAYEEITSVWPMEREWEQGKVFLRLYRKPGVPPMELKPEPSAQDQ